MRQSIMILVCSIGTMVAAPTFSQQTKLDVSYKRENLGKVLDDLRKQSGYQIVFFDGVVPEGNLITLSKKEASLEEILQAILPQNGLTFTIKEDIVSITAIGKANSQQPRPQQSQIVLRGRVVDEKGNPIVGASVIVSGTTRGVQTDANGRYQITVPVDAVMKYSYLGFKEESVLLKGQTTLDVQLTSSVKSIEEVVVVAFGSQTKESVVASVTTIRPMDLKSSSSDLTTSLTGRIPGIIGWQTGGIPGALTEGEMNTKFYIRGISSFQTDANIDPLILIDGIESSKLELARMSPEDIDTFSVLKDASATAMYGARGANGVIIITTKKGHEGSVYTSIRYETVASMSTSDIEVMDPITYMTAYNQALLSRDDSAIPKYSVERIDKTGSSNYPSWVYPANDWYNLLFKDLVVNHRFGLNIRGGGSRVQYYTSINHTRDDGMIKTDKLNDFSVNIRNSTTTFRTNLNIDLHTGIQLLLNTSINYDNYHGPMNDVTQAYYMAFNANPVDFAPMYPGDDTYSWPHLRYGYARYQDVNNPYMAIQRGYRERNRYNATIRAEYIQNLATIFKGLELRASFSFSRTGYGSTQFDTNPAVYSLENYDFETGKHTLYTGYPNSDRTLSIPLGGSASTISNQIMFEGRLMHTAAWGGFNNALHQTSFTAVFNGMESNNHPVYQVLNAFPHRNLGISTRGTYGFKERYYAEASFGYNGSERFAEKNRMGFFPAMGIAWVVSKEPFMESISHWLPFLKLRATYGKTGNDGIISNPRFVYVPTLGQTQNMYVPPEPGMTMVYRNVIEAYPNPNIKWEIAETVNFGLETQLFNGLLEFNVDVYQEIRHNIIANRVTIPATVGIEISPMDNIGKVRSRGVDFSGKIQHMFNNDFWIILNGTFTYNKAKYLNIEEATEKPVWQRKIGHEISQQVGYIAEGLFRDQAEIDNSPQQGGSYMPGDIRYRDINGDGIIDVNDAVYIGYPTTPRAVYGLNGFINFKNWEFNFAFQGSGKRTFFINPSAISPFVGDHALLKVIWDDHWSEDNMKNKPFWPRLSTYDITHHNPQEDWGADKEMRLSTYFMRECWFVRCTSLELSYNLPGKLTTRMGLQNIKFTARANNPFIISDFDLWDVELGENGFNYPIQKTYSLGVSVSF